MLARDSDEGPVRMLLRPLLKPDTLFNQTNRRAWVEDVMEGRMGRVINLLPFILVMAIAAVNLLMALWLAFGFEVFLLTLAWYRSRYNPAVPFPLALSVTQLVTYTVLLILAYTVPGFPYRLVTPIVATALFATVAASLLVRKPFSMQFMANVVDDATWNSPEFMRTMWLVSGIWCAVFGVMTICVWIAYGLFPDPNSAGFIALGVVVPIVLPVLCALAMRGNREMQKEALNSRAAKKDEGGESERLLAGEGTGMPISRP
jgi:signal transduction histidine kinase